MQAFVSLSLFPVVSWFSLPSLLSDTPLASIYILFIIASLELRWDVLNHIHAEIEAVMVKWKYSKLILTYSELLKVNIISTYFTLGMGYKSCSHVVSEFAHVDPTVLVLYILIQFPS